MLGLERGTVELVSHRHAWAEAYEREAARLQERLGDRLLAVEHVGSTAVEGLDAKPVVDLLGVVADLGAARDLRPTLADAGYEHREESVPDRLFFAKGPREARTHYLSLCERGSDCYRDQVLFRDYLRANPETRDAYCRLKRELAERYPEDRASYTAEKASFVEGVIELATTERDE